MHMLNKKLEFPFPSGHKPFQRPRKDTATFCNNSAAKISIITLIVSTSLNKYLNRNMHRKNESKAPSAKATFANCTEQQTQHQQLQS